MLRDANTGTIVSRIDRYCLIALALVAAALVGACAPTPEKLEEVPSPDTYECMLEGQRWLVRFVDQEARLLTPQGERINLYQIPSGSGVRFTNGLIELRGKGMELTLIRDNFARQLLGCKPVMIPKEPANPMMRMWQPPPPSPLGK
jgi:membrane-bound inhibitor of C-type lysozyme